MNNLRPDDCPDRGDEELRREHAKPFPSSTPLAKAKRRLAGLESTLAMRLNFYKINPTPSAWQEAVAISLEQAKIEGFKLALEFFDEGDG